MGNPLRLPVHLVQSKDMPIRLGADSTHKTSILHIIALNSMYEDQNYPIFPLIQMML